MNKTVTIILAATVVLCAAIGGGAWWWVQQQGSAAVPKAATLDANTPSYVTLDKIVVMLRPTSLRVNNSYMSVDLVFRTDKAHEKAVKADLPMLKGVAVRTLSKLDVDQARAMTIEEWTALISRDLMDAYEPQMSLRAFDQVMVSRLIIE